MQMVASTIGSSVTDSALHAVLVLHPKGLCAQDRMLTHTPFRIGQREAFPRETLLVYSQGYMTPKRLITQ